MFHIGFMKTVLSIMRCVCFSCSKLLADEEDYKFKQALKIRNPKNRLKKILDACKSKCICEGGDDIESVIEEGVKTVKKGHGGCGSLQPTITIDGLKMVAEYKLPKKKIIDLQQLLPEPAERKQQLSAERVLPIPPPPVRPSVMMDTSTRSKSRYYMFTLITGTFCKRTLGASTGSLIHVIWEEVGPDAASKFLGHNQWLVNYWLLQQGFSIGIGDTIADASTMETINETIFRAKNEVNGLIRAAQDNQLKPEPGRTMMESFENKVNQVLNKARDDAGSSAQKSISESNNLKAMVTAGSKGSFINISHTTACVGQHNIEGKRIPFGFMDRTLPRFTKDDYGPKSRRFVENSYLRGLTPQEFFFHAMGGREENHSINLFSARSNPKVACWPDSTRNLEPSHIP
nr:RNA polymerase II largest subunit [Tanacetum cinerariifolium]